jgi:hypothetical protein
MAAGACAWQQSAGSTPRYRIMESGTARHGIMGA